MGANRNALARHEGIVRFLIDRAAAVLKEDYKGTTLVLEAAKSVASTVPDLLSAGAAMDVLVPSHDGLLSLHLASYLPVEALIQIDLLGGLYGFHFNELAMEAFKSCLDTKNKFNAGYLFCRLIDFNTLDENLRKLVTTHDVLGLIVERAAIVEKLGYHVNDKCNEMIQTKAPEYRKICLEQPVTILMTLLKC